MALGNIIFATATVLNLQATDPVYIPSITSAVDSVSSSTTLVLASCDTTGFPRADGTPNTTGPSRGAVFTDQNGDGINTGAFGDNGRPCSVPMEVFDRIQREGGGKDDAPTPDAPAPAPNPGGNPGEGGGDDDGRDDEGNLPA